LESWTRRRSSAQALALRSRIVFLAADGLRNAAELGIHRNVIGKWRSRFLAHRLDGLTDEPRPGRSRTISDEQVEEVIVKTLETAPKDATHWSTRSLAREVGLTQSAVQRIGKAFGLQPHRQETWKLSKDPQFLDKVRDVVGLSLNPPERAVVLCVDEKSQIQALSIARRRSCRCCPARRSARPTIAAVPAHRASTRRWTSPPARSSAGCTPATARSSSNVPADARPRSPSRPRRPSRARQLLHGQDPRDPALAGRASPLRRALHADIELVAQPRRALVRRADDQGTTPRGAPLRLTAQRRHPRLDRHLERRPAALRLDQNRRRDPRLNRPLLPAN
jgi:transposase